MKYLTITCVRGKEKEREGDEVPVSVIEWLNEHVCVCVSVANATRSAGSNLNMNN